MTTIMPCLWFDKEAEEAAELLLLDFQGRQARRHHPLRQ
jgi:predicted 3-demethylubiquinone-9 3-methyltransferase (glyoxalase superfamily)